MSEQVNFIQEPGADSGHDLTVYALSTCGFCKRALSFLRDRKIAFKYIYIDELPGDVKEKLKEELRKQFDVKLLFPFLVIDGKESVTGFLEEGWKEKLGLK